MRRQRLDLGITSYDFVIVDDPSLLYKYSLAMQGREEIPVLYYSGSDVAKDSKRVAANIPPAAKDMLLRLVVGESLNFNSEPSKGWRFWRR